MWSWIFNSEAVQRRPTAAAALRDETNYERAYSEIQSGAFDAEDRQALTDAVRYAYLRQDDAIRGDHDAPWLDRFLSLFQGRDASERGYFFTLNQDAMVERFFSTTLNMTVPGLPDHDRCFSGRDPYSGLSVPLSINVDGLAEIDQAAGTRLHYVKLHGSINWKASDGTDALVIGTTKTALIERETLLRYYSLLFRRVLSATRLLCVIGYSFRDPHINEALALATSLTLCVINPSPASAFRQDLYAHGDGFASTLWNKVVGYFPYSVGDLLLRRPGREHPAQAELHRILAASA